jgi:hypothetical protein
VCVCVGGDWGVGCACVWRGCVWELGRVFVGIGVRYIAYELIKWKQQ